MLSPEEPETPDTQILASRLMVIFYMQMRGVLPCLQREALFDPVWYSEGGQRYNVAMEDWAGMVNINK